MVQRQKDNADELGYFFLIKLSLSSFLVYIPFVSIFLVKLMLHALPLKLLMDNKSLALKLTR